MAATLQLTGLDGNNPAGYLAGLGALVVAEEHGQQAKLKWNRNPAETQHAILLSDWKLNDFIRSAKDTCEQWAESYETDPLNRRRIKQSDDTSEAVREHILACLESPTGGRLTSAYLIEYCLNNSKTNTRTSEFDFTPGKPAFWRNLRLAMKIASDGGHLRHAVKGTCDYKTKLAVSNWEPRHYSTHALSAVSPSSANRNGKRGNPGLEALARLGMSMLPAVYSHRLISPAIQHRNNRVFWVWGLWDQPMSYQSIKSLIASMTPEAVNYGWGVFQVNESEIINALDKTPRFFASSGIVALADSTRQ